jgi:uncharacterized membrane protein YfbV (UPF0208 family)
MNKILQWQVERARKITDKAVEKVLVGHDDHGVLPPVREALLWTGSPGFVATFNSQEFFGAVAITVIVTIITTIMFGNVDFPVEVTAILAAFLCSMGLLFIGWVRQVCRYVKTLGMYYAVTDSRLVIIKNKRIIAQMQLCEIKNTAVHKRFFGNGSIVFNQGEDYLKNNPLEAPSSKVFAFFNVLDLENVLNTMP